MHRVSMLVRALYPFRSTSANELSIHATQRLALIEGGYNSQTGACWGDCGWVRVATLDGLSEGEVRTCRLATWWLVLSTARVSSPFISIFN